MKSSRKIMFRAWDNEIKKMIYGDEIEENEAYQCGLSYGSPFVARITQDWDELDLMEQTGKKDKNGVDIYEKDVILLRGWSDRGDGNYDDAIFVVFYDDENCQFRLKNEYETIDFIDFYDPEVIGSSHEIDNSCHMNESKPRIKCMVEKLSKTRAYELASRKWGKNWDFQKYNEISLETKIQEDMQTQTLYADGQCLGIFYNPKMLAI